MKVRTAESQVSEVFINANDLIIELMRELDKADSSTEKEVYGKLIRKLTDVRDKNHA